MEEGSDVREHVGRFFDAVDKLKDMEVDVNKDVLAIALLYSLPPSFDNFRVAIESRDDLPEPEDKDRRGTRRSQKRASVKCHVYQKETTKEESES